MSKEAAPSGYCQTLTIPDDVFLFVRDTLHNTLTLTGRKPLFFQQTFRCRIQGNTYRVHCFFQPMGAIDAGNVFYWCEPFGLLFFRSRYWPSYGLVQDARNQERNRLTWSLAKAAHPRLAEDCRVYFSRSLKPGQEHIYSDEWEYARLKLP